MNLSPFKLSIVRGASGDQLGTGSSLEEVEGMALAHATETSTANFELSSSHGGYEKVIEESRGGMRIGRFGKMERVTIGR